MGKKQDTYYFNTFTACAEDACRAAQLLKSVLENFKPEELETQLEKLHEIEHSADEKKHDIMDHRAKEFIPPIEREHIVSRSQKIDNVTDKVEDILLRVYMNNVSRIGEDALALMDVVVQCCEAVRELLLEFADFRRSKNLKKVIIRINDLEEAEDKLFMTSMRKLYIESKDPIHIIAWREIYIYLERCADACEHVADEVDRIIMKKS